MHNIMIKTGNFFFRWRDTAFTLIFLGAFLLVIFRPQLGIGDLRVDMAASIIGFMIALTGQIIRALTIGLAYIKRGGLNKQIFAETLVRRGMFAHSRNPLYLGNMLIVTGAIVVINNCLFYTLVLPLFYFIYFSITLAEEQFLSGRFGPEYQDYLRTVNRFIPGNLKDWGRSTAGMDFTWKRLIKKEHSSTTIIFFSLALFTVLKLYFRHRFAFNDPVLIPLWGFMGLLILFQITAEILKRSGRLEWDQDRP